MQPGQEPRYMVTLLFPKQADLAVMDELVEVAAADKFGGNWRSKNITLPWRDGDEKGVAGKPGYEPGARWLRVSSTKRPDVVDRHNNRIEDKDEIYGGCYALVTLRAYGVEHGNMKRVTFGLQNVMKLLDGEKLGGGAVSAAQEFEPIEDLDNVEALLAGSSLAANDTGDDEDELSRLMG